ncbi:MAG: hypothetical protein K8T25_01020, partial [Planctomycetia bacterium]|nr:hypothetical protein [Planctomycetia bacterium]
MTSLLKNWRAIVAMLVLFSTADVLRAAAKEEKADAPVALESEQSFDLPEKYDEVAIGGGGRYYIFYSHKSNKLQVFDVAKLKLAGEIEVPEKALICAGREKLIIVLPGQKLLQRWDLATLEREKTVPVKTGPTLEAAMMGSDSDGPVLLWEREHGSFFDIKTMQQFLPKGPMLTGHEKWGLNIAVSADGKTWTGWVNGGSGGTYTAWHLSGKSTEVKSGPGGIYGEGRCLPNADGSLFLTNGGEVYDRNFKRFSTEWFKDAKLVPTDDPRFFIAWRPQPGDKIKVDICTAGDRRVVYSDNDEIELHEPRLTERPKVRYWAKSKLLVVLPEKNESIVLKPLDWIEEKKKADPKYLFLTSAPPTEAASGTMYSYQVEAESKTGGLKYSLESGPQGMKISESGELTWRITGKPVGGVTQVVVNVKDKSGKEVMQSFEISVVNKASQLAAAGKKRSAAGGVISKPESTARSQPSSTRPSRTRPKKQDAEPEDNDAAAGKDAAPEAAASEELVKTDAVRVELPKGPYSLRPGLGQTLLVLHKDRLATLGPDGHTILKQVQLDKEYADIAERPGYYVAVSNKPQMICQIDKETLKVRKSMKVSFVEARHVSLHPTKPITYVSSKRGFDPPRYKFIVYNESTNEGREADELIGNEMIVEPEGRWMITSWDDLYKSGSHLIVNPGQVFSTPDYTSIDVLIRYELGDDGMPREVARKEKAGGNGRGMRMSNDGKRVTYLSVVGYPEFSGNLAGWDPLDFKKMPATYSTKDVASASDLAYHPILPLVASPGSGSAVFFERESGDVQNDRLKNAEDLLAGAKPDRVYFSPDGRNLILDGVVNEIHYLHKLPLNLSPEEQKKLAAIKAAAPAEPKSTPSAKPAETADSGGADGMHTWTDSTGTFQIVARFGGLVHGKVHLVKKDGTEVDVPMSRLSAADQQYAQKQAS